MSYVNPFSDNALKSRDDVARLVKNLVAPLEPFRSEGGARISLGGHATVYSRDGAEMEGFSRPLWGLIPLAAGGFDVDWSAINNGLANGTDPTEVDYWGGPLGDRDQRFVEMAAIGFGLLASPPGFADLPQDKIDGLVAYLNEINLHAMPPNNWHFFRVLVNCGFQKHGLPVNKVALQESLDAVESFYLADGWYADGQRPQRDWYVPFGMQYYGLIYARHMKDVDPERCESFMQRARDFATDHALWFGPDGAAIPFGRSMTYRFAQASFWSALVYAGVEALPWGQIKGYWFSHLRWWADKPIFDRDGVLSVGYGYSNLTMAEPYNSPGSPYWGMKAFLPLALPVDHPFWQAEEVPIDPTPISRVQPHAMMILNRDASHAWALSGGQQCTFFAKCAEKYGKFAYSSTFGFSAENTHDLNFASVDSALALSDDGQHFRVREEIESADVSEEGILTVWKPYQDVEVATWLAPMGRWHLRVHRISTPRGLDTLEGGFSLRISEKLGGNAMPPADGQTHMKNQYGFSGLVDPRHTRSGRVTYALPNTNLIWSSVVVPQLVQKIPEGETWLYALVFAGTEETADEVWAAPPNCDAAIELATKRIGDV